MPQAWTRISWTFTAERVRGRLARVLDEARQQLGVMSLNDAVRLAQGKGLDLME